MDAQTAVFLLRTRHLTADDELITLFVTLFTNRKFVNTRSTLPMIPLTTMLSCCVHLELVKYRRPYLCVKKMARIYITTATTAHYAGDKTSIYDAKENEVWSFPSLTVSRP